MSIKIMSQVWESKRDWAGSKLLVMLALADYANDDGYCWPSVATVAKKCRLSERQAQRIIHELIDDGALEIAKSGDGRGHTSFYRIKDVIGDTLYAVKDDTGGMVSKERVTSRAERVSPVTERVTSSALKGDIAMSPDPLVDPSLKQPSLTGEDLDPVIAQPPTSSRPQASPPPATHQIDLALPKPPTEADMVKEIERSESTTTVNYKPTSYTKSLYMRSARLRAGYVAPGAGVNAVQVFHERYSAADKRLQLTEPQQDDLVRAATDIKVWREVVIAWNQKGYNPMNLDVQLEWYMNGGPPERGLPSAKPAFGVLRGPTNHDKPSNGQLSADEERTIREGMRRAAADRAARAAGQLTTPDPIVERIKQQMALERGQGLRPA